MKDLLKKIVIERFNEVQNYTKAYNKKAAEQKEGILKKASAIFQKDPSKVDINEIARDVFMISGFHQSDIRKLQEGFLSAYKLYREAGGEETFEAEIEQTVEYLKMQLPKQVFTYNSNLGEFTEIETGRVEQLKKDFEEKNYFKVFEETVKKALANESPSQ